MLFIEKCKDPKSVAILIRAGLERLIDEAERALNDSLSVLAAVMRDPRIVAGGGSIEAEIAKRVEEYSSKVGGREQLAVEAFAKSLETIPRTLAENAGLNPIDIMADLRTGHERKDGIWVGVDVFSGKAKDMMKAGIIEPLRIKQQAIKSAVEAASMILRVDDVIAAAKTAPAPPAGGGGMGGMGGMPPGMM
jgi:chaperonin GroEL (HSP60 family)